MTRQQRTDLNALLTYAMDDTQLEDFYRYLRMNRDYDDNDIKKLRDGKRKLDDAWRKACADPEEKHIYAVAWRLCDLLNKG